MSKVSSALIKQAGGDMIEECKDYPLEKTEILRVTGAPNLSFKNIIHLVTPENPEKICKYLMEVFKLVETKFQHRSLAVPAIGTGKRLYTVHGQPIFRTKVILLRVQNLVSLHNYINSYNKSSY